MSSPRNSTTERSGSRTYSWPSNPPFELQVPSVTTILSGGLPKQDVLKRWAAKSVAEFAVEHQKSWTGLPADAAVDLLKGAPFRFTKMKADIGTAVHNAVEAYTKGEAGYGSGLSEVERGYFNGALKFLSDHNPKILFCESQIYSRTHGYAGTSDKVMKIKLPGSKRWTLAIGDYKTGKRIYDDYSLQLCAYARGDFIGGENDEEIPVPEGIRDGVSIRLLPDGTYQARHFLLTDELFKTFLSIKEVFEREATLAAARGQFFKKVAA